MTEILPEAREAAAYDDWVFNWFNQRYPDEMRECLDAYDEQAIRSADHASQEPQG